MLSAADADSKTPDVRLGALKALAPYALAYRGRIVAALVALVIASAATLVVPIAVRRMIDYGFSVSNAGLIRDYFLAMIGVVAVLALASGARYYLVMTLGERVVADASGGTLHPSDISRSRLLRWGEDRRARLAPFRRHHAAQGDFRFFGLNRATQYLHVFRRDAHDGRHQPQTFGVRSGAIPLSSCRFRGRTLRSPAVAQSSGQACRGDRLCSREPVRSAGHAVVSGGRSYRPPFRDAAFGVYEAARAMTQARAIVTAAAIFLAFSSVVASCGSAPRT